MSSSQHSFRDREQNLIDDWANFCFYITFFAYGCIAFAAEGIMDRVMRSRWLFLGIGCLGIVAVAAVERSGIDLRRGYHPGFMAYMALRGFNNWSWALAILGFAKVTIDRAGP